MKLYIGNLSFNVTEEDLKNAFSKFGNIEEASIIVDKFSKRSKGFAFVTFSDDESGKKAISEMDGKDFEGRALKVSVAKPMEESDRPRRSFGGGGSGGGSRFGGDRGRDDRRRPNNRRRF